MTTTTRNIADLAELIPGLKVKSTVDFGLPASIAVMSIGGGAGKTSTLGTIVKVPAFKDKKIVYLDFEDGTKVWANDPQIKHAVETGQITLISIDRNDPAAAKVQIDKLLGYKDEDGQKHIGALFSPAFDVDVIAVDTLDTMQEIGLNYFRVTTFSENGKQDTRAAYRLLKAWTMDIAWELHLGKPLALIASHAADKVNEKSGTSTTAMMLAGSARDIIDGVPDLVALIKWQTTEDQPDVKRLVAYMDKEEGVSVKNRWSFTEPMWDFSMPKLYAAIEAKIAATDEKIAKVTKVHTKQEDTAPAVAA